MQSQSIRDQNQIEIEKNHNLCTHRHSLVDYNLSSIVEQPVRNDYICKQLPMQSQTLEVYVIERFRLEPRYFHPRQYNQRPLQDFFYSSSSCPYPLSLVYYAS